MVQNSSDFFSILGSIQQQLGLENKTKVTVGGHQVPLLSLYEVVEGEKEAINLIDWRDVSIKMESLIAIDLSSSISKGKVWVIKAGLWKRIFYSNHLNLVVQVLKEGLKLDVVLKGEKDREREIPPYFIVKPGEKPPMSVYRPFKLNPDDDGKDGGWHNRIALGLKSGLPNEVDWAFQKLIKLSFQHVFFVGYIPGLLEGLVIHASEFFDLLQLRTLSTEFETLLKAGSDLPPPGSLFLTRDHALKFERVLQTLHVFRNMSFMPENAAVLARSHKILIMVAKGMALPLTSHYIEVQQHCLDIFENIGHLIVLRGPEDFYLACLKKMIYSSDRAKILGGIKSLVKLMSIVRNIASIQQLEAAVLQRLVQLLLVPDEELVMITLEFLYLFTNSSPDCGLKLARSVRFNILTMLFRFAHWRGLGTEVFTATVDRLPKKKSSNPAPILRAPPANLPPNAIPHFHAAMWLQSVCEKDPAASLSYIDFYDAYSDYCGKNDLELIMQPELLKLVAKVVSDSCISSLPPLILGLKPRIDDDEEEDEVEMDVDRKPEATSGLKCGIDLCSLPEFVDCSALATHIESHSLSTSAGICPWFHCKQKVKNVAAHVFTHIPLQQANYKDQPSEQVNVFSVAEQNTINDPPELTPKSVFPNPALDLKGIQLTALLVVRNIAKNHQNHLLFGPFENHLSALLTSPMFSKTVAMVFAELALKK